MYIISKSKVNKAINQFIEKEEENKDGVIYPTVPEENREFMEQFLQRFYRSFESLFKDKTCAQDIFCSRLIKISAVRFDDKDQNLMPLKIAFDDMKETCKDKLDGGLLMPEFRHGIVLLDMDFLTHSKAEAMHTLIHELLHALSVYPIKKDGKMCFKSGINRNGRAFNKLNEGVIECVSQLMWSKMFKNKKCPGIGRYAKEVKAAQVVMSKFDSTQQFIEDYFVCASVLEAQMKDMKNIDGKSLFNFLKSFDNENFEDIKIQQKFLKEIENYNCELIVKK